MEHAVVTQWIWLAFVAILNSAISLDYDARVVKAMYVDKGESDEKLVIKKSHLAAILLCVFFVIAIGVYPEPVIKLCEMAAAAMWP